MALVGGDGSGQAGLLLLGEPLGRAAQDVPDPVQRVAGTATVTVDLLLHAAANLIDRPAGQGDHMESIMQMSA